MAAVASCEFDQHWRSDCCLRVSKLGDVLVKSKFNFCTAPPVLDMSVQVEQHTWKLSFLASNRRESRVIGLEYWPLRLHMNFFQSSPELATEAGQSVVGCIESLKNGEELCFLNTTLDSRTQYEPCQLSEVVTSFTMSVVVFCLILTILLVACSVGSFVWWRRRESNKRNRKERLETCVPPLPQSRPYVEHLHGIGSKSSVSICSRSRPVLHPIEEESTSSGRHMVSTDEVDDSTYRNPSRWRESKLIQTSLPSLEAAQNLMADGDRAPSSSRNSENGSGCQGAASPNGPCQTTNDKEKLICSSSSSESSV